MSVTNLSVLSPDPQRTMALAAALAARCVPGDCLLLRGELGAGKTTFARGFIRRMAAGEEDIVSPTFTIAQTYATREGATLWHFDLYRLQTEEETREIGMEEALEHGIVLVEWPEIIRQHLPADALDIHIACGEGEARMLAFSGETGRWKPRLAAMEAHAGT